ncbi:acyltransferase [uncultured Caulobacter sp.]|uniref:acyltransferase n=1 Tax=uncultured Caulobacter sp. TaxID=158749 RepID=UPI00260B0DB0|nr:acyltransferase [uncultured Caulobacter sp.]
MHNIYKAIWAIRAAIYNLLFGSFKVPGYLGRPIFLLGASKIFIAERVRILPGIRIEVHGEGRLEIRRNVRIGQNVHITCASELVIDEGTIVTGNVVITDIDHEYRDVEKSVIDQPFLNARTRIGRNCFIGAGACIQAGTALGDGCIVGANSVVRGHFPAHSVVVGVPARVVKRFNRDSGVWERAGSNGIAGD